MFSGGQESFAMSGELLHNDKFYNRIINKDQLIFQFLNTWNKHIRPDNLPSKYDKILFTYEAVNYFKNYLQKPEIIDKFIEKTDPFLNFSSSLMIQ